MGRLGKAQTMSKTQEQLCVAGQIRKQRRRKVNWQAHQLAWLEGAGISSNPGPLRTKPKPSRGHKAASSSPSQGASGAKGEQEIKRTKKKEKHFRLQERCLLQTSKGKDQEPRRE